MILLVVIVVVCAGCGGGGIVNSRCHELCDSFREAISKEAMKNEVTKLHQITVMETRVFKIL